MRSRRRHGRSRWNTISDIRRPEALTVHAGSRRLAGLLRGVRLVVNRLELHLDALRLFVQGTCVEFRVQKQLVDHLDRPGGRACVRVIRVGLAEEGNHVEVPLASLVQEDASDARNDAFLEDRDVVVANEVHRLFRGADAIHLDLPLPLLLRVHDESLGTHEEVAWGVLGPVEDRGGDCLDEVRWRLELGNEPDDLVVVVLLRTRIDPDRIHRLPVPDQGHRREVDGIHDSDLREVQRVDQVVRHDGTHEADAREAVDDRGAAQIHALELINLDAVHGRRGSSRGGYLRIVASNPRLENTHTGGRISTVLTNFTPPRRSMIPTEQYFSDERSMARFTADSLSPFPRTRKWRWTDVRTFGSVVARSASASISSDVNGTRSFRRIQTTSEAVQPIAARRAPCMGLGPIRSDFSPASNTIGGPSSAWARKRIPSVWTR